MSRSNCAFVNYKTEAICIAALKRFDNGKFHGSRLVCRLRKGDVDATTAVAAAEGANVSEGATGDTVNTDIQEPVIVNGSSVVLQDAHLTVLPSQNTAGSKVPERYFIMKSLTLRDLEDAVRSSSWTTQLHNENLLDHAYDGAVKVFLVFSANNSGGFFGYARMASSIKHNQVPVEPGHASRGSFAYGSHDAIATPATMTTQSGLIYLDLVRGTALWNAHDSTELGSVSNARNVSRENGGLFSTRSFEIEWRATVQLPFYRTRGLRNPWNSNKEVKIARDGTELEPSVGKRLVQMFHQPI